VERVERLKFAVASEIRKRREACGLSQEGLADLCGLHRTYVGAIERGERNITVGTLMKISDALQCEIIDLIPTRRFYD
jgi:transcriptional regulator with XRE-family HTH domain